MARREIGGSRALVTGSSAGIGRAIARELAKQGADLFLVARREERLRELADELRGLGRRCEFLAGDITEASTRQAAIDAAVERLGGLDILVNNAGVGAMGPFASADPQRLRRIFDVNLFAPIEMIRTALPALRQGRRPIIVNVGSILSHVGMPHASEYSASKFAIRGFSEVLRAELHPRASTCWSSARRQWPARCGIRCWKPKATARGGPATASGPRPSPARRCGPSRVAGESCCRGWCPRRCIGSIAFVQRCWPGR